MTTQVLNITNLNDKNFDMWNFKIKMYLIKENLWSVIEGETPTVKTEDWIRKDQQARSIIALSIEDAQIVHIRNAETAKETLNKLQQIHERVNLTNKLSLLRKLYNSKFDETRTMQHHINGILEIAEKLRSIGEEVKETHLGALLLNSLPKSYETLITALEARDEAEIILDLIKQKLLDEYDRKMEFNQCYNSSTSAFKTTEKFRKVNKFCNICHRQNHNTENCYHKKDKQNENRSKYEKSKQDTKYKNRAKLAEHTQEQNYSFSTKSEMEVIHSWTVDSGASSHMTNDELFFEELNFDSNDMITTADGTSIKSKGKGHGYINCKVNDKIRKIKVEDVLFIPELESNLLSVRKIINKGLKVEFKKDRCEIKDGEKILAIGLANDNSLYKLQTVNIKEENALFCKENNSLDLWHRRCGHRNIKDIKDIEKFKLARGIQIKNKEHSDVCEICLKGKMSKNPVPHKSKNEIKNVFEVICSDIMGPFDTPTIGQKRYVLTFIDMFSGYTHIFLLETKDKVLDKFKQYVELLENKFEKRPKSLLTDNGKEYTSFAFEE